MAQLQAMEVGSAKRRATRWAPTQCNTFGGSFELYNLHASCSANKTFLNWQSPAVADGRWKLYLDILEDKTLGSFLRVGVYLSNQSGLGTNLKSRYAYTDITLKCGGIVLAKAKHRTPVLYPLSTGPAVKDMKTLSAISVILQSKVLKENDISQFPDDHASWLLDLQPPLTNLSDVMAALFDDVATADVCFYVRHKTASDDRPKRIYAHTKILSAQCNYFKTLFKSGFAENQDTSSQPEAFDELRWEVGSDSDYEGVDYDLEADATTKIYPDDDGHGESVVHGQEKDEVRRLDQPQITTEYKNDATRKRDNDIHQVSIQEEHRTEEKVVTTSFVSGRPDTGDKMRRPTDLRKLRTVYIMDSSYRTHRALLYYLYTGCIAFAPLRSTYNIAKVTALAADPNGSFPSVSVYNKANALIISPSGVIGNLQWVSAKSMYRLCDKLDILNLKTATSKFIHNSLTPDTVVHELRSIFSSLFPDMLKDQDAYLKEHWSEVCKTKSFEIFMADVFASRPSEYGKIWHKHVMSAVKGSENVSADKK